MLKYRFVVGEHAVSAPLAMGRRPGGAFATGGATVTAAGDTGGGILSPRGSDNGGLGVKMVEYVLGTSPTGKESMAGLEPRMRALHLQDDKDKDKPAQSPKEQECNGGQPGVVVVQNGQVGGSSAQDDDKGFK